MYRDRVDHQNERYQMVGSSSGVTGLAVLWAGYDQASIFVVLVSVLLLVIAKLAFDAHAKNRKRIQRFTAEVWRYSGASVLIKQENVTFAYCELQKILSSMQVDLLLAEQNGCYVAIEREQQLDKLYDRIHQFTDDAQWLGFEIPKPAKVTPFKRRQIA